MDKRYPGIKIEHFESIPEPLVQRIIAESQAGKPSAVDIIQSGSLRALRPLIDRDMLSVYTGWEKVFSSYLPYISTMVAIAAIYFLIAEFVLRRWFVRKQAAKGHQ